MSGNPKSTSTGGQQMRFTSSPFQPMQQPSIQPGRDSYSLTQSYVSQQPNQAGSQGAALRSISQGPPPNQAPTPPNADIKVPTLQQQNQMYTTQPLNVRQSQNFIHRSPGPTNQTPRMQGQQHRGQQPVYQATPSPYLQMQTVYTFPYAYQNAGQPRNNFVQQPPAVMLHHQQNYPFQAYAGQHMNYSYFQLPRAGPPPQPTSTPSNQTPTAISAMSLTQPIQPQMPINKQQKTKRQFALPIIDPTTGADIMEENQDSHPPSGESSARQTPQPPNQMIPNKEVQAVFHKQVNQSIMDEMVGYHDNVISMNQPSAPSLNHHVEHQSIYQPTESIQRYDHVIQNSNLKPHAREFPFSNTANETPIVSANTDAEEITLPNKQKSKESPAKGRKPKDLHKEAPVKDNVAVPDKSAPVKEENPQSSRHVSAPVTIQPPPKDLKDDNKKSIKKENKLETKEVVESEEPKYSLPSSSLSSLEEVPASSNAKNKNSSRTKDAGSKANQFAAPPQKQVPAPAPTVPTPKAPKPGNKANKKAELNIKGAMKEGTEMDLFISDAVNANATATAPTPLDVANANATPLANVNNVPTVTNSEPIRKNETNETPKTPNNPTDVSKSAVNPPMQIQNTPGPKYDVTDVFKGGMDKMVKPYVPQPPSTSSQNDSSRDKFDRTKKLVQSKNETNAKISMESSSSSNSPATANILYEDGQWSPLKPNGKKVYGLDLLMKLREVPNSKVKPPNLPEYVLMDDRPRSVDNRPSLSKQDYSTYPNFGKMHVANRGGMPSLSKRGSSSKISGKGKSTNGATNKISISLREDVKLHESENAWKPMHLNKEKNFDDEEKKTEELKKKVRGILNKLTPEKFNKLLEQMKSLPLNSNDRLGVVIDLIFEKALDEPNFSSAYAKMCQQLSDSLNRGYNPDDPEMRSLKFKSKIITRCQDEFEKQNKDENKRKEKEKSIAECTDPEKLKDLELDLEEYDRKIRMKSVGNVRFIGELYKIGMLTSKIMFQCLDNLIRKPDEESLECLCKLLSTVGLKLEDDNRKPSDKEKLEKSVAKEREINSQKFEEYFKKMDSIANKRQLNCSSRIRFMLKDVIDLRDNKWVPRRQDLKPKMMDQILREAESEQLAQAISAPPAPRKDDNRHGGSSSMSKGRPKPDESGWQTERRSSSRNAFSMSIDRNKIRPQQVNDTSLGSSNLFGNWSKGSSTKTGSSAITSANKFAALDSETDRKSSLGPMRSKDVFLSKSPSLERNLDGRNSRSGSLQRTNERSSMSAPAPVPKPAPPPSATSAAPPQKTEEELERFVRLLLDEYIHGNSSFTEYDNDVSAEVPTSYLPRLVADGFIHVLEKKESAFRIKTGGLFAKLIWNETLPLEQFCIGLEEIFGQADELAIDIPMIWNVLAESIVALICEEALPLSRLHRTMHILIQQRHAAKLLSALFKLIVSEKGEEFLAVLWHLSELKLTDFMSEDEAEKFAQESGLQFLAPGYSNSAPPELTYNQIQKKLLEFFNLETQFDDICNWITANVGDRVRNNQFIRNLAMAIYKHSIVKKKLMTNRLENHYKLFQKYIDNHQDFELQCLYALQFLVNELEHPPGLLLSIVNKLSEDGIFSKESFIAWDQCSDPAEQAGKGVATKQLTCFFTQLRENEEDDYGSTGSDEA